jgi:RES domain-containing protein
LTRSTRAHEAFNGEGARLFGGRWNSPGQRAVYTSGSRALALLENLVHLDTSGPLPAFSLMSVELDDGDVEFTQPDAAEHIGRIAFTRPIGDRWLRQCRSLALAVPSVVVPQEFNFVLNPTHPRFLTLRPSLPLPFLMDDRLYLAGASSPRRKRQNT